MKKSLFLTLLLALVCVLTFSLVACDGIIDDGHTHTFAKEWSTSDTEHWHAATCEHTDKVADKQAHDWKITVTQKATPDTAGTAVYTCKVCGKVKEATFAYDNHEHVLDWTSTYRTHVMDYVCCDKHPTEAQTAEKHTFNANHICEVCHSYSVVDEAREVLDESGIFDAAFLLKDVEINLSLLSDSNNDIHLNNIVVQIGLDNNCNLTAKGVFDVEIISTVTTTPTDGSDPVTTKESEPVNGMFIIRDNTVYLQLVDEDAEGNEESMYVSMSLTDILVANGMEGIVDALDAAINQVYANGADVKELLDKIQAAMDESSIEITPFDPETDTTFGMFFVKNEDGSYTSSLDSILMFNNIGKQLTLNSVLMLATETKGSEEYIPLINSYVTIALNTRVSALLKGLETAGYDLRDINKKINSAIAKSDSIPANSLEDLLRLAGVDIAEGKTAADLVYDAGNMSLLDILNLVAKANNPDAETITLSKATQYVSDFINRNKDKKIYDLLADVINIIGSMTSSSEPVEGEETATWTDITGETIYTAIDQIVGLVNDAIKVNIMFDEDGNVVYLTITLGIEKPATEEGEAATQEDTTEGGTTTEPEPTPDPVSEQIKGIVGFVRTVLESGIAKGTVGVKPNFVFEGIDFEKIITEATKTATAA